MSHNIVEVVNCDEAIIVKISLRENVVELFFCEVLSEIFSHFLQLVNSDLSLNYNNITDLFTSKEFQTFSISALLSLSPSLAVASLKNSAKSMPPD